MKPKMGEQFRKDFELITPTSAQSPLDEDYKAVGSKTTDNGVCRPLQFTSQGEGSKTKFIVDMSHCDWR